MNRFTRTFERLRAAGACGLFPYLTAGYPDVATSQALAEAALERAPMASRSACRSRIRSPTARRCSAPMPARSKAAPRSTPRSTWRGSFASARPRRPLRSCPTTTRVRQRGDAQFAADLAPAEADGAIVPDLPPEEASTLFDALACRAIWPWRRSWRPPAPPRASAPSPRSSRLHLLRRAGRRDRRAAGPVRCARPLPQRHPRRDQGAAGGRLRHFAARARPARSRARRRRRDRRQRPGRPGRTVPRPATGRARLPARAKTSRPAPRHRLSLVPSPFPRPYRPLRRSRGSGVRRFRRVLRACAPWLCSN